MAQVVIIDGKPVLRDEWHPMDVESVADDMEVKLTEDQVLEVMEIIARRHDANIGINWDVIGSAIDYVLESA
jgi:hypothetical protein